MNYIFASRAQFVFRADAVVFILVAIVVSGCGAPDTGVGNGRHTDAEFVTRAGDLQQFMSTEEVKWLIGPPDSTSVDTVGTASANGPWNALIWKYNRGRTLTLYFSSTEPNGHMLQVWRWDD